MDDIEFFDCRYRERSRHRKVVGNDISTTCVRYTDYQDIVNERDKLREMINKLTTQNERQPLTK